VQANGGSSEPSLSSDGRYLCFASQASNLVPGDANGLLDVFVRDLQTGTIELVSSAPGGIQGNGASHEPDITPDGRFVAFASLATNFGGGPTSAEGQVYVRGLQTGAIELVSSASPGVGGAGFSFHPSFSDDGRFVAFASVAADLVGNDFNVAADLYVRDRLNGTTELVSVALGGLAAGGCGSGMISDDGRFVLFDSNVPDLVPGDTNAERDIFVRDLVLGVTERANVPTGGSQSFGFSRAGSISATGRFVSFMSGATDLVPGETGFFADDFLRDRFASGFESLCGPGSAGVIACPCANPPAGAERGCDNSAATGGAALSASGAAYLAGDSLVFTTAGQTPIGTSVLVQGDAVVAGGAIFGQGVRCAGGTLTRLYTKPAVGGSIVAPDFQAGELPVSVVSAALGDPIAAGQSRWYLVYYRDPVVLGGCSAASTFNATQTGQISWFP